MMVFLFITVGVIVILAAIGIAYGANQRNRARQSNQAKVNSQQTGAGKPTVGRATGLN